MPVRIERRLPFCDLQSRMVSPLWRYLELTFVRKIHSFKCTQVETLRIAAWWSNEGPEASLWLHFHHLLVHSPSVLLRKGLVNVMSPDRPSPKDGDSAVSNPPVYDRKKAPSSSTTDGDHTEPATKVARKDESARDIDMDDNTVTAPQQQHDQRMEDASDEESQNEGEKEQWDELDASRNLAANLQKLRQDLKQLRPGENTGAPGGKSKAIFAALFEIIRRVPWFPRELKNRVKYFIDNVPEVNEDNYKEVSAELFDGYTLPCSEENCKAAAFSLKMFRARDYLAKCKEVVSEMKESTEMAACLLGLLSIMSENEKTSGGKIGKGTEDYIAQFINREDDSPDNPAIWGAKENILSKMNRADLDISEFICETKVANNDSSVSASYERLKNFAPSWPPSDAFPPLVASETTEVQPQFHRLLKILGKFWAEEPSTNLFSPAKSTARREVRIPPTERMKKLGLTVERKADFWADKPGRFYYVMLTVALKLLLEMKPFLRKAGVSFTTYDSLDKDSGRQV